MPTNLNTLKARVRAAVEDCELPADNNPEKLRNISEYGKESLFLKERLISRLAEMMQKHEEWAERNIHQLKCTECNHYHNPTAPCHVS